MRLVKFAAAFGLILTTSLFAQATRPAYLAHFSPDDENLLVIYDPVPHLEAILKYPPLRQAIIGRSEGPIAKKEGRPDRSDPLQMLAQIRQVQGFIPREIAIATSGRSLRSLDPLVRSILAGLLMSGAREADSLADVVNYQALLLESGRQLQVPDLTLFLRMRSPFAAQTVRQFLQIRLSRTGIPAVAFSSDADSFRASVALRDLTDEASIVELAEDVLSPVAAAALWQHLQTLEVHLHVKQTGDGLRLAMAGAAPQAPTGLPNAAVPADLTTIASGQWNVAQLKKDAAGWIELWKTTEGTEVGDAARELDDEGTIDSMLVQLANLADAGDRGTMRLWRDRSLHFAAQETGAPALPPLEGSAIARVIPANAGMWHITTRYGLGTLVADQFLQAEERLEQQRLRGLLGDETPRAQAAERIAQAWYGAFADAREFILHDVVEAFDPGAAMMIQPTGSFKELAINVPTEDGEVRASVTDLPVFSVALIGRPKDAAKAEAALETLYRKMIEGWAEVAEARDVPATLVRDLDLKLGVPTHGFVFYSPKTATGRPLLVSESADVVPHYFTSDGLLIFSTSPALSRDILAARQGRGRLALPLTSGQLITAGALPMAVVEHAVDTLSALFERGIARSPDNAAVQPLQPREPASNLSQLRAAIRLLKDARWQVEQRATGRNTSFELNVN